MVKKLLVVIMSLPFVIFAAEWHSLNGPSAGRADDMSMGLYEGVWVIYAADQTHKLYKSTNGGELWQVPTSDERVNNPTCVITDESNALVVYLGKNDATPVWKSEDGGEIWEPKSYGITNICPRCFCMDPNNSSVVYAGFDWYIGANHTIFKTTNGGTDWHPCGSSSSIHLYSVRDILVNSDNPQIGYAATTNSVWKSTNGGNDWIRLNPPGGLTDVYCLAQNTTTLRLLNPLALMLR